MLEKLQIVKQRFDEVSDLIIQPDIITDQKRYIQLNKEYKDLRLLMDKREQYIELTNNLKEAEADLNKAISFDPTQVVAYNNLGMVLEEAERMELELPVARLVDGYYAEVQAMGGGRWDTSSLFARMRAINAGQQGGSEGSE